MILNRRTILKLALAGAASPVLASYGRAAEKSEPTRWIILGSKGGPRVTMGRSNPANVLLVDGVPYVIDCGYGVAGRLAQAKVPLSSLKYVLMTHLHSDHSIEYGNLLYAGWATGLKNEVEVFAPAGVQAMTEGYWQTNRFDIETRIVDEGKPDLRKLVKVTEIRDSGEILSNGKVRISALRTPHPPINEDNYAYRFETPDGVLVYACDTAYNPALAEFAKGADVLIHEALYVPGVEAMAARVNNATEYKNHILNSHTTTEDVGRIAAAAGVKKLVLSHLVPGDDPTITDEMWLADVRKHFDGEAVVARDMMEITL